jgi:hypothetical protein
MPMLRLLLFIDLIHLQLQSNSNSMTTKDLGRLAYPAAGSSAATDGHADATITAPAATAASTPAATANASATLPGTQSHVQVAPDGIGEPQGRGVGECVIGVRDILFSSPFYSIKINVSDHLILS